MNSASRRPCRYSSSLHSICWDKASAESSSLHTPNPLGERNCTFGARGS
ncbi:hypothetical protein SUNI508_14075, partial [Seiridium unicorne]